jgi:CheY-like chemotaxis protein
MQKPIPLVEDNPNDIELSLAVSKHSQLSHEMVVDRDEAEAPDYLFRCSSYARREKGIPAVVTLDMVLPKVDLLEFL